MGLGLGHHVDICTEKEGKKPLFVFVLHLAYSLRVPCEAW